MAKFRKKPVVVEAVQFTGYNRDEVVTFLGEGHHIVALDGCNPHFGYATIATLEGPMTARRGDWIIRGVQGELYPCKPDIFEATYEPAD